MLQTLHFFPRPVGHCRRVLGVLASQAGAATAVHFSVPAHALLTWNLVLNGDLQHEDQQLPPSFATGAHTRSRRYRISGGATLLTLFCRADAAHALGGRRPRDLTDTWLPANAVVRSWSPPAFASAQDPIQRCAALMLASVAPQHLPPQPSGADDERSQAALRVAQAVASLATQDLAATARALHMSERSLQRLFLAQWGVSPKLVQRMMRVQQCFALWQAQGLSLAGLAAQAGLSDQAHLAREFRQLVGYAPGHMKRSSSDTQQDVLWALRTGSSLLTPLLYP